MDLILLAYANKKRGYLGFAVVLITQVVEADVETDGVIEVEAYEG